MKQRKMYLIILIIAFTLLGCHSKEQIKYNLKYEALIYDCSDSGLLNSSREYTLGDKEKYAKFIPEAQVTVSVGNLVLTGTYEDWSYKYRRYNTYPEYDYKGKDYRFTVSPSGKIVSFYLIAEDTFFETDILAREESVNIAKTFLANLVDIRDYEIEVSNQENLRQYEVTFTKYIGNYKTTDSAVVSVSYSGEISAFFGTMLGEVTFNERDLEIDLKKVEESARDKITRILEKTDWNYDRLEWEDSEILLTRLKEGGIGFIYIVNVSAVTELGEYTTHRGQQFLFVVR